MAIVFDMEGRGVPEAGAGNDQAPRCPPVSTPCALSPPSSKENCFGLLRLILAALVILSHSSELIDGNRYREPLTMLFGTLSFGEVAVDGFFLISGYLIVKSYEQSRSIGDYLLKRVFRIYPGYVVSFLVCLCLVGPLAGGVAQDFSFGFFLKQVTYAALLKQPSLDGAFHGLPYEALNGSMWTIAYEFRCYLLIVLLGFSGVLARRKSYLMITVILVVVSTIRLPLELPHGFLAIFGSLELNLNFFAAFCCGGAWYLFRDRVRYDLRLAVIAGGLLAPLMFDAYLAQTAFVLLGGYILFSIAFGIRIKSLVRIGTKTDLSYGIYLYGWPIQNLLIWYVAGITWWSVFVFSTLLASVVAYGSWSFLEAPAMRLAAHLRERNARVNRSFRLLNPVKKPQP